MGSQGREDSWQGSSWWTQQGGGLWNGAGQATVSRPHKVVAGRPCSPTFEHRNWEEQRGSEADHATRAPAQGNKASNL